jgi:pimeloyl-ACP methyl ester carboxylesterase
MRSAEENFARASSGFQADVRSTVRALFRAGNPAKCGKPDRLAFVRARGGWFGPDNSAPAVPRDERVIGEEDEDRYVVTLERNGFAGPDSWYMNAESNIACTQRARPNWRLTMPVLFLHGAYDYPCETIASRWPSRCAPIAPT